MVLGVFGYRDPWRAAMSDATCIGLQLANFWQDVRRDLRDRGRIYLPLEDMGRFGVSEDDLHRPLAGPAVRELIAFEVERARDWLEAGAPLARVVPWRVGLDLRMFTAGGLAVCDAIARQGHDTLRRRPAPGRLGRARIAATVLWRLARGRA
jgi:phytoene/squalene synthetase